MPWRLTVFYIYIRFSLTIMRDPNQLRSFVPPSGLNECPAIGLNPDHVVSRNIFWFAITDAVTLLLDQIKGNGVLILC